MVRVAMVAYLLTLASCDWTQVDWKKEKLSGRLSCEYSCPTFVRVRIAEQKSEQSGGDYRERDGKD